jgi:PAS domain S-box-containing protein
MSVRIKNRLSVKQAKLAVSLAVLLGLFFGAVQIAFDFSTVQSRKDTTMSQYLNTVRESASQAAFSLDYILGRRVVAGLMQNKTIVRAEISLDLGGKIAFDERTASVNGDHKFLDLLFPDEQQPHALDLYVEDQADPIGTLTVWVHPHLVYEDFVDRIGLVLLLGMVHSIILAGLLMVALYFQLTRRLVQITDAVGAFDFKSTEHAQIDVPPVGDRDELGVLSAVINQYASDQTRHLAELTTSEEKRRLSEQRFRDFAESSSDWFWEMDAELKFIFGSKQFFEIVGKTEEAVYGRHRRELVNTELENLESEKWKLHFGQLERREPFRNFQYDAMNSDGKIVHLSIDGNPAFNAEGEFTGYLGTGSDVSKLVATSEQLRRAQRMEAVGQLTGGIAHDFNNLLAVMIGNAEILRDKVDNNEQALNSIDAIINSVERGSSLTNRLLAFSRKQAMVPVAADVTALIDGLEDMLRRTLGETIDLKVVSVPGMWPVTTDPHQFENALLNLAINARDAMPGGGSLTIETGNVSLDEIYTSQEAEVTPGDYVEIAVSDTGTGMSTEVLGKVFEPFFTTKEVGKGSGLGLSMVYGFAKQSNGHATIYSEVGRGTTVKLYVPRSRDSIDQENTGQGLSDQDRAVERILVVEDDPAVREVPVSILRAQGYDIVEATDAVEAMARLRDGAPFDLLFTDIALPGGMSGVDIADAAKDIQPDIKVLYTTGYTENALVHRGNLEPGTNLVNKPYRRTELLEKVRANLSGNHAAAARAE